MAERRPPGFNVPLGFYDGPEVESIPRRIRASAIGVWTLCGTFSANKLQDGYVGPAMLKQLGCTDAIRAALKATKGPDGAPDPLWIDARGGGIQFTKWVKYQRSRAEVKAYRKADAERKKAERNAAKQAATSDDSEMSGRTSDGLRSESRDPSTKTETKEQDSTHLSSSATDSTGRGSIAATPGADLVRRLIPKDHPDSVRTTLRIRASELIHGGTAPEIVGRALELWLTKTQLGPNALPSLVSEVIKTANGANKLAVPASNGVHGLTAGEAKVAGWASLGNPNPSQQGAIEA
jgi:hypothetical protein